MIEIQFTTESEVDATTILAVLAEADDNGEFDFAFNTEMNSNCITVTVEDENEKREILDRIEAATDEGEIDFAFETSSEDVGSSVFA